MGVGGLDQLGGGGPSRTCSSLNALSDFIRGLTALSPLFHIYVAQGSMMSESGMHTLSTVKVVGLILCMTCHLSPFERLR